MSKHSEEQKHDTIQKARAFTTNLVKKLVKNMRLPPDVIEELEAAANLGLVEAAEKYDPTKGVTFTNFAYLRIRGAVIDAARQISSISRYSYQFQKAMEAVQDIREFDVSTSAVFETDKTSADEMLAKVFDIAADGAIAFRLTFEDFETEASEEVNQDLSQEDQLNQGRIRKKLLEAIATLPEQQRLIVEAYYFHDKSFVEIADEETGKSKSWISRLHQQALNALKDAMGDVEFEDFFPG
jgi:RNA polymerase sigma factor for flagellar operon FliA